jgi:hypothetical protein
MSHFTVFSSDNATSFLRPNYDYHNCKKNQQDFTLLPIVFKALSADVVCDTTVVA